MSLDERDYREKNQWRRWVWNRLVERMHRPTNTALALYLAGASDLDRKEAERRGFRPWNLISVDANKSKIATLRAAGVRCIQGDAFEIAAAWKLPIDVINLDFCSGPTDKIIDRLHALMWEPHLLNTAFAVNLMRGRDQSFNDWREAARLSGVRRHNHRGVSTYAVLLGLILHEIAKEGRRIEWGVPEAEVQRLLDFVGRHMSMKCAYAMTEYRSSTNQTFDTVVFKNPLRSLRATWDPTNEPSPLPISAALSRRIAAWRAHQTMQRGAS